MSKRIRLTLAVLLATTVLSGGAFVLLSPQVAADKNSSVSDKLSTQIEIQPEEVQAVLNHPSEQ